MPEDSKITERTGSSGKVSLAERLRAELEQDIAAGRLRPGSRLDEVELADRFGVSRTPVREALRLLASSNLVEKHRGRGVIVSSISVSRLVEMFTVMAELEALCAQLAARRASDERIAELRTIHERLVQNAPSADLQTFYEINTEFHEAIYEASANGFLAQQVRLLRNQVAPYRRHVTRLPSRVSDTLEEHDKILQAISDRDPARASQAMRGHVALLGDDLLDLLAMSSRSLPEDPSGEIR